jgi:hypothetical protein
MKWRLLFIGLLTWAVCGGAAERFAVFSPNKLFIAAGSPLDGQFELSLHKVKGKNTELVWSNSFPETTFGELLLAFVSEKEPAVVIQSGYVDKDSQADLAFVLNGKLVRSWRLKEVLDLIPKPAQKPRKDEKPADPADPSSELLKELETKNREDDEQRERGRIWHSEGTIQRFEQIEGSTVFCLWFAGYDNWLGWTVTNGASFKLPDSVRVELNTKTRAWSTNLIANKEKLFEAAKDPAASAESYFRQPDPDRWHYELRQVDEEIKMAYKFVAKKKFPEDRVLLEQLLIAEPGDHGFSFDHDEQTGEPVPFFSVSSSDRNMGDFLLAEWDKKLSLDRSWDGNDGGPTRDEEYVRLGRIYGNIRFNIPLTNGTVWAYLIPAKWEVGRWKTNAAAMTAHEDIGSTVELFGGKLPSAFMPSSQKKFSGLVASLQFGFEGALPGTYRIKAVWDKNTSAGRESNPTTIPKSYQLESAEVGPVTVVAGRTLKGLTIWCTNQVTSDALATKALTSGDRILDPGVRPLSPLPEPEQEYEIMAATFRHIASRHLARLATPPTCFFLATGKHGRLLEPPPELLEKLKGESIPIKSFAAAVVEKGNYVNGDSHEVAPVIQICPIEWQEDQAIVPGKAFSEEDRLNYVETKYVLVRRDGRWTVLGHKAGF